MRVFTPPARGTVAVAACVVLGSALVAIWAVGSAAPPEPPGGSLETAAFDTAQAMRDVAELSRAPHPVGSAEHARVRSWIIARLEALGLEVEVQRETLAQRFPTYVMAAEVHNIVARRPGGDSGREALLLAAHYDTRPTTPGAGDDSSGVAVVLEVLRALEAGPPIERDVVVLISDGEELGLFGARAFVDGHRWAASVGLVMNFEARGNGGAAIMFETGEGNRRLVESFARVAPRPTANSLTFDVYQRMPNDTDFTIFKEAGWTGYNFAFIEGYPAYHTALDRPAALSAASLHQEGSNALALLRHLGNAEIEIDSEKAVYFNPSGGSFVVYSRAVAVSAVTVAGGLMLVVAWLGRRRGWLTGGGLLHALILWVLVLVGAPVAGTAAWLFFRQLAPVLEQAPHGFHYASTTAFLALVAVLVGVGSFLASRQLGPRSLFEIGLGVGVGWWLLSALTLLDLTGASYLVVWPAGAVLAGLLVALGLERDDPSSRRVTLVLGVAALPAVILIAPVTLLLVHALTLQLAIVVLVVTTLGLTPLLPHLAILGRRSPAGWALGLIVAGLGLLAWIGWTSEFTAEEPRSDSLFYVMDLDSGTADWWSLDRREDDWTSGFVDPAEGRKVLPALLPLAEGVHGLSGEAALLDAEGPDVEVVKDERTGGGRQVGVVLRSRRGAPILHLRAEAAVPIDRVAIDGRAVDLGSDGLPVLQLVFFGLPAEGIRVDLDLPARWPVDAILGDQSYGLAGLGVASRPDGLMPSSSWWTDSIFVSSGILF